MNVENNQRPNTYLGWAIASLIIGAFVAFCVFGAYIDTELEDNIAPYMLGVFMATIVLVFFAIVYSSQVNNNFVSCNYRAARNLSRKVLEYTICTAEVGIVIPIGFMFFLGVPDENVQAKDELSEARDWGKENIVETGNEACLAEVGEGITLKSVELVGNYIVNTAEVDKNKMSLELMGQNTDEMKTNIIQALRTSNDAAEEIPHLKTAGVGCIYRYIGDTSGQTCTITIEPNEI